MFLCLPHAACVLQSRDMLRMIAPSYHGIATQKYTARCSECTSHTSAQCAHRTHAVSRPCSTRLNPRPESKMQPERSMSAAFNTSLRLQSKDFSSVPMLSLLFSTAARSKIGMPTTALPIKLRRAAESQLMRDAPADRGCTAHWRLHGALRWHHDPRRGLLLPCAAGCMAADCRQGTQ